MHFFELCIFAVFSMQAFCRQLRICDITPGSKNTLSIENLLTLRANLSIKRSRAACPVGRARSEKKRVRDRICVANWRPLALLWRHKIDNWVFESWRERFLEWWNYKKEGKIRENLCSRSTLSSCWRCWRHIFKAIRVELLNKIDDFYWRHDNLPRMSDHESDVARQLRDSGRRSVFHNLGKKSWKKNRG